MQEDEPTINSVVLPETLQKLLFLGQKLVTFKDILLLVFMDYFKAHM